MEAHAFSNVEGERIPVTISVGAVTFPDGQPELRVEDYIHHADLALYRSKSGGRNRITHYADIEGSPPLR